MLLHGIILATYALIYSFLLAHSHVKAAAAVKKAVKDIVVLKENVPADDDSLDKIVKWWKGKKVADASVNLCSIAWHSCSLLSIQQKRVRQ
jgi:hypothetical protein